MPEFTAWSRVVRKLESSPAACLIWEMSFAPGAVLIGDDRRE